MGLPGGGGVGEASAANGERLAPVTYLPFVSPAVSGSQNELEPVAAPATRTVTASSAGATAGAGRTELETGERAASRRSRPARRATNVAIHQLARRGMSRHELERVLDSRGVMPEVAAEELDRLESLGLVDDAALAVSLVYSEGQRKGKGATAIRQELQRRGIAANIISDALGELDQESQREKALELARHRLVRLEGAEPQAIKRRLYQFLLRKGYESETIGSVLSELLPS